MTRRVLTVEAILPIPERGAILCGGKGAEEIGDVRVGDSLRLVRPDGSSVTAILAGIVLADPGPAARERGIDLLLRCPTPAEIPLGTEVWTVAAIRP